MVLPSIRSLGLYLPTDLQPTRPTVATNRRIELIGIAGLPEIKPGDSISRLVTERISLLAGDVLVLAQKIVSKAEGRLVRLSSVTPSEAAKRLAETAEKDPRLVQLILDESKRVVRVRPGLIIVETRTGWICANAGIDRSNIPQLDDSDEVVCLLPVDPDGSAEQLRDEIRNLTGLSIGVVINDSHGRAWRDGTVGVALGSAGVQVRSDRRGEIDRTGYILEHTIVGTVDEVAAAGSLLMGQGAESLPAVIIRGADVGGEGRAAELQRPPELDLFR